MNKGSLSKNINMHFQKNFWLYMVSLLAICIGIVIGIYTVKYMSDLGTGEISSYLSDLTRSINLNSLNYKTIFIEALKNNIPVLICIWFLGMTMIGMPFIFIADIIKGFTIGFTISFMIDGLGIKGIWIVLLGILPQNIIYIPCIILSSVIAMEFSLLYIKERISRQYAPNFWGRTTSYSLIFLLIFLVMCGGFILETYLTPNILKLVSFSGIGCGLA